MRTSTALLLLGTVGAFSTEYYIAGAILIVLAFIAEF